jgi:hypothetical protein
MSGGVLNLDMSDRPNDKAFGSISTSTVYRDSLPVPVIDGARVFKGSTAITMRSLVRTGRIHYTLDGSEPSASSPVYAEALKIQSLATVKAAVFASELRSKPVEARFFLRPNDWTVKILSPYSSQYTGGGDDAIIDGLRGTPNFASGEWQGYEGKIFEAVIDLKKETVVKELGGSFLQAAGSWIWMPDRIEFETSMDGVTFTRAAEIKPGFPQREMESATKEFRRSISPTTARYVRVRAYNFGKIPSWHPGAGGDPWIFVDEIFVD